MLNKKAIYALIGCVVLVAILAVFALPHIMDKYSQFVYARVLSHAPGQIVTTVETCSGDIAIVAVPSAAKLDHFSVYKRIRHIKGVKSSTTELTFEDTEGNNLEDEDSYAIWCRSRLGSVVQETRHLRRPYVGPVIIRYREWYDTCVIQHADSGVVPKPDVEKKVDMLVVAD